MSTLVVHADAVTGALTPAEQAVLATIRGARRRLEWTRGRLAAHQLVDGDVLVDPDGAPRVATGHVSISHDGDWIAVAHADRPIGLDLCLRAHAPRIPTILRWLGVTLPAGVDPVVAWAAFEAVLKLRRMSVEQLRDRALSIVADGRDVVVRGLGDDVSVAIDDRGDFVVARCG